MIRTAAIFLFLVLFFIISQPFYVLIPVISKFDSHRADCMTQGIVCWAMRVILTLSGVDVEVRGRENVRQPSELLRHSLDLPLCCGIDGLYCQGRDQQGAADPLLDAPAARTDL